MRRHAVLVLIALCLVLAGVLSTPTRGAFERSIAVTGHDPIVSLDILSLSDVNGKGKKFKGTGEIVLSDARRIAVAVKLVYNAKKLRSKYTFKTPKKALPKAVATLKTKGDPEALVKLTVFLKDDDGSKTRFKEKAGSAAVTITRTDPELSAQTTLTAVRMLVDGDDDFDTTVQTLDDAIAADFRNDQPLFFRAVANLLAKTKATGVDPTGTLRNLYVRGGALDPLGTGFWDLRFGPPEVHGQGSVKDTMPTADEVRTFVRDELIPALQAFIDETDDVPDSFEYRIAAVDSGGEVFDGDPIDDVESVWVDGGDVALFRSAVHVVLASLEVLDAYDWDDLDLNDFDNLEHPVQDELALIESTYGDLMTLVRPANLSTARNHLGLAHDEYVRGSDLILAESAEERDNGLFSPYRSMFRDDEHFAAAGSRAAFLADETGFRTWLTGVMNALDVDAPYASPTGRDGAAVPVAERHSLNLFRFLNASTGVDLRDLYFHTITNPFTGEKELGLTGLGAITSDMLTAGGVVDTIAGVPVMRGDLLSGLQGAAYSLRIDAPATGDKTVDGSLSEWMPGVNATHVFEAPSFGYDAPRPAFGDLHLSVGSGSLFVGLDGDPDDYVWLYVSVVSPAGYGYAELYDGIASNYGSSSDPSQAVGAAAFEASFPLANYVGDAWVQVEFVGMAKPTRRVYSGAIYVNVE